MTEHLPQVDAAQMGQTKCESEGPKLAQLSQCPEPVEGISWIYVPLMRNDILYVGQTKNISNHMRRHADGSGSRQAK